MQNVISFFSVRRKAAEGDRDEEVVRLRHPLLRPLRAGRLPTRLHRHGELHGVIISVTLGREPW